MAKIANKIFADLARSILAGVGVKAFPILQFAEENPQPYGGKTTKRAKASAFPKYAWVRVIHCKHDCGTKICEEGAVGVLPL